MEIRKKSSKRDEYYHEDYDKNMSFARGFAKNTEDELYPGMSVVFEKTIAGERGPLEFPIVLFLGHEGIWSNPVDPFCDHQTFKEKLNEAFSGMLKVAQEEYGYELDFKAIKERRKVK